MDLDSIKEFLRITFDDEDNLLTSFLSASEQYLKNAGVVQTSENKELYELTVKLLISHFYENRDINSTNQGLGFGLQSLILQLKQS